VACDSRWATRFGDRVCASKASRMEETATHYKTCQKQAFTTTGVKCGRRACEKSVIAHVGMNCGKRACKWHTCSRHTMCMAKQHPSRHNLGCRGPWGRHWQLTLVCILTIYLCTPGSWPHSWAYQTRVIACAPKKSCDKCN